MSGAVERARGLLARPGAWVEAQGLEGRGAVYLVRLGADRRSRVNLTLDEAGFRALVERPGLKTRAGGGWVARPKPVHRTAPEPGRPGTIEGTRVVMEADGSLSERRANVGESPIAWLARRKDQSGRPWLTPAQVVAGERLRMDAEIAQSGPSLTMRWDALPRSGTGSAARVEPGDRAMAAGRRVETALSAVGPRLRPFLVRICIEGSALQLAEREQGLRRRQGKTVLKEGLQALAEHYGIGA